MEKIRVVLKRDSPNSSFGYYHRGDKGYVVGYTQGDAVVILDNGKFAKPILNHIERIDETEEISGNNGGISSNSELTEFEKWLKEIVNSYCQRVGELSDIEVMTDEGARNHGAKLLDIARKQLDGQRKNEEFATFSRSEFDAEIEKARAEGKEEALKDMPKWKKNLDIKTAFGISCERYDFIEYQGLYLKVADLIEKLPKEE